MHLAGLSGLWGGFAATCLAAALDSPSAVTLAAAIVTIGGIVVSMSATRKLEERITGRRVRPWPLGYPGLRAQILSTLPSTVIAAARRLNLNAPLVAGGVYGLLAAGVVAFFLLFATR
jgi:hypothetical protein